MITYVAQIGNSDNKLSQENWSRFIDAFVSTVNNLGVQIHFCGFSAPHSQWQNCCVVFEDPRHRPEYEFQKDLETELAYLARLFEQDSIALTYGATQFVTAAS